VNGTTLEGFPPARRRPTISSQHGRRQFENVAAKAAYASGWGQGACVGDYDNDGRDDLFVTYYAATTTSITTQDRDDSRT
jgi:hypothetical protein